MTLELVPAKSLEDDTIAELFTAVYAGYWHPIEVDAAALRRMIATYDLDLETSVVAMDGEQAVGLAMLAVRGERGWVGGMGVLPERRGEGIGALLTRRLLDGGRERGVTRVRLEVLEQNEPAIGIYRRLGFVDSGDVAVWRLKTHAAGAKAADADLDETLESLAVVKADVPWQRNPATVANMRALGSQLTAVSAGAGRAVYAVTDVHASMLQLDAATEEVAAALLVAPIDRGASALLWLNGPVDGVAADALRHLGAAPLALQHELTLDIG
jgi:GNAT superfamily N-acetyltransferase